MTDEQIVEAAKSAGENNGFGKLVYSPISKGVNSAYGIGFLEGAEWAREQMLKEAVEGEVVKDISNRLAVTAKNVNLDGFKFGDKVRIIIIKEDEE